MDGHEETAGNSIDGFCGSRGVGDVPGAQSGFSTFLALKLLVLYTCNNKPDKEGGLTNIKDIYFMTSQEESHK